MVEEVVSAELLRITGIISKEFLVVCANLLECVYILVDNFLIKLLEPRNVIYTLTDVLGDLKVLIHLADIFVCECNTCRLAIVINVSSIIYTVCVESKVTSGADRCAFCTKSFTETCDRKTFKLFGNVVEAIDGALIAGAVGLALIVLFMIVMYRLPGVAASMALAIYVLVVMYVLAITKAQLTLQGIAGILLGIGMAVDANVIIFERFREEMKLGRTLPNAVKYGFKNAFSSILDSNVTTVIASVVLLVFGTGSIKGFAMTLLIGVIVSFLTAVFVTRWLLKAFVGLGFKKTWLYTR